MGNGDCNWFRSKWVNFSCSAEPKPEPIFLSVLNASAIGAVRIVAVAVDRQAMIADIETLLRGYLSLPSFDGFVNKFLDLTAFDTHDVVVVLTAIQFEHRMPTLEIPPLHQSSRLKLRQHAVNRRQSDLLIGVQQHAVDILGTNVPLPAVLQQFQYLDPGQGDLESSLSDFLFFQ